MEKRFIMLELPNNIKEERNVLGVIKQPPAEVHDYRSILAEIQKIVAKINEIDCNNILDGNGAIREFDTIMAFSKWYKEEYSPKIIEGELKKKSNNSR